MDKLKLEFPTLARKKDALDYMAEMAASDAEMHGVGGLHNYLDNYEGWVDELNKKLHLEPNEELVPSETYFLVRESDNRIVGMIDIRLVLNHNLWNYGGHIGYSVRPSERRKGYNKVNLYLALCVCDNYGVEMALLDCDKKNIGSSKSMRALGGKMIYEYFDTEKNITIQKYVIDVKESLAKNKDRFSDSIARYPK